MAAKKSPTKSKKPTPKVKVLTSKSEFIRQNSTLPVKEIISKAAKAGVGTISAAFCYTILSEYRKKQAKGDPSPSKSTKVQTPPAAPQKAPTSLEATLIDAVVDLGGKTVQELLATAIAKVKASAKK